MKKSIKEVNHNCWIVGKKDVPCNQNNCELIEHDKTKNVETVKVHKTNIPELVWEMYIKLLRTEIFDGGLSITKYTSLTSHTTQKDASEILEKKGAEMLNGTHMRGIHHGYITSRDLKIILDVIDEYNGFFIIKPHVSGKQIGDMFEITFTEPEKRKRNEIC